MTDMKYKSRTPNKLLVKENSETILSSFKLESMINIKTEKSKGVKSLFENHTEKKLQSMKYDFYIKNFIESKKVGNTSVGVYKKISSPLISESLKNKFSKVFKETIDQRPTIDQNNNMLFKYNLESRGNKL
jgi:hypothetical protein